MPPKLWSVTFQSKRQKIPWMTFRVRALNENEAIQISWQLLDFDNSLKREYFKPHPKVQVDSGD